MKQVVILASDFSPSSSPPALRLKFLVQHLREFGWEPTVVTVDPKYYEGPVDPENGRLLPESLQVIRTKALPSSLTRRIGIGDIGLRSLWHHWRVVARLCKIKKIDLAFIPTPPPIPAILGRLIHGSFGIPYVIDYQDPWVTPNYWGVPWTKRSLKRHLSYLLSVFLEPFVLKHVSHLVGVSKGLTDRIISRYPWLTEAYATEIPAGGEMADFDYLQRNPRENKIFKRGNGLTHISYVGVCPSVMEDTVRALFLAVRLGLNRAPQKFKRLRLHFVGTTYALKGSGLYRVLPLAKETGVENFVDEHPQRVSYLDALQLLLDSDALIAIGSDAPYYTASKIFPCILSQKPILAVFHEKSTVVNILKETGEENVVTFSVDHPIQGKIEEISKYLEKLLSLPAGYQKAILAGQFEPYTARAMTRRLAQVFDQVLAKRI